MPRFILRRLLLLPPILLAVSAAVFIILHLGDNDPAMSYLRLSQIPPTDQALAAAREYLGLDRPLPVQYGEWLWRALHLDFGLSYVTRKPVLRDIFYYLPATLVLASVSLGLTILVSLPLGILAALRKDRLPDHLCRAVAFTGVSIPNFWLGFLLVYLFSLRLGWLPPMGRGGPSHIVLPAVALAMMSLAVNARLVRASMLEQMGMRFVMYARARGVVERFVIGCHVLKNAMLPVVTAIGMHIGELLGGTVVVEVVFAWPGLGRYAVSAIYNRDYPVMQCFILLMAVIFILCNLAVDVLYAWLDPRIRLDEEPTR